MCKNLLRNVLKANFLYLFSKKTKCLVSGHVQMYIFKDYSQLIGPYVQVKMIMVKCSVGLRHLNASLNLK